MTTALVTADWHLNDIPRDLYRHDAMKTIRRIAREKNVDYVFILGDLTEEKDHHGAWLVNQIAYYINALAHIARVYIIKGNHDYTDEDHPFYEWTKRIEGVRYIVRPTVMKMKLGRVMFLPHTNDHKTEWDTLPFGEVDLCLAHNTFQGAVSESGKKLKGISPKIFSSRCISGDIHVPQNVGPVTYVGAPYTIDFGDDYAPRVLTIDHNMTSKTIPVPGPQKKILQCVVKDGDVTDVPDDAREGDIVKIRVFMRDPNDYANFASYRDKVMKWALGRKLHVHAIQPIVERAKVAQQTHKAPVSDEEVVRRHAKRHGLDAKTTKVGINLLQEE